MFANFSANRRHFKGLSSKISEKEKFAPTSKFPFCYNAKYQRNFAIKPPFCVLQVETKNFVKIWENPIFYVFILFFSNFDGWSHFRHEFVCGRD
jgi:hypothetical protein